MLIVTPVVALVMRHLSRAIRRASRRAMEEMSQLYGMLNDSFAGIRVVKAFNTQAFERAKFNRGIQAFYRKSMKMAFYNTLARSSSEMLGMTTVGLAILAGGYLVVNQTDALARDSNVRSTVECYRRLDVFRIPNRSLGSGQKTGRRLEWFATWDRRHDSGL